MKKDDGYYVIDLKDKNVSAGSHTLAVKLKDNEEGSATIGDDLATRENIEFEIERVDNVFTDVEKYYISATSETIELTFYNPDNNIDSVYVIAPNGDIVARSNENSQETVELETKDPRYTGIGKEYEYSGCILYKSTWVLSIDKNALEIGNYDIRLTLDDTERTITNAVEVSSKAVVSKCVLGIDYDNTSGFVYLYIQGSGFNPSQIQFDFKDKVTEATFINTTNRL